MKKIDSFRFQRTGSPRHGRATLPRSLWFGGSLTLPPERLQEKFGYDLGYAVCGEVIEVGGEVTKFKVGDRVATMQHHQQFVASPVPTDRKALYVTLPISDDISWQANRYGRLNWANNLLDFTKPKRELLIGMDVTRNTIFPLSTTPLPPFGKGEGGRGICVRWTHRRIN